MTKIKFLLAWTFCFTVVTVSFAKISPEKEKARANRPALTSNSAINFREDCVAATAQTDQNINNVRARLLTGGDVWWDPGSREGKYIVPAPPVGSGLDEVSSLYAGAVWLGGLDPAGNLKVAATDYRSGGQLDFYPGPLNPATGLTDLPICQEWDRFFKVLSTEIKTAIADFEAARLQGIPYDDGLIPANVKFWPGNGNPFFFEQFGFDLPNTGAGSLGAFWDEDQSGTYDPTKGDFPIIDIRGCEPDTRKEAKELVPDEMIFWIYNDAGGPHSLTQGTAINMEVQVQSFAYATNDEVNDMTFQRYKLINRASTDIQETYFGMWVDPDLGCASDDYSGCDIPRSLAYTYNQDAFDGTVAGSCDCGGVPTYCEKVPLVGTDYFRGPTAPRILSSAAEGELHVVAIGDEFDPTRFSFGDTLFLVNQELGDLNPPDIKVQLGMSSFMYYNNSNPAPPDPQTVDPSMADEYYNILRGIWRDEVPLTVGGTGYLSGGPQTRYAFFDPPNDPNGWSMAAEGLGFGDRRTVQASGPFLLKPGARNELIIGAVWVPDVRHPNPDISRLQAADDIAQNLFDNCFDIIDGPDAPDVCLVELDREIILVLSNDTLTSNNAFEAYSEIDILSNENIPEEDRTYKFEGYKVYQLLNASVSPQELDDIEKARLVRQVDVKNGVSRIYNWSSMPDPNPLATDPIWAFEQEVEGADEGVDHTFRITEDAFSDSDPRLVNHKIYYFMAVAYGYNNYETFDPKNPTLTQRRPYLEGRGNIKIYEAVPRRIIYQGLNSGYGEGAPITRLSGVGAGGNNLDLEDGMRESILDGSFDGELKYKEGAGPINIKIYNPLEVVNGDYQIDLVGEFQGGSDCSLQDGVTWVLTDLNSGETVSSETSIDQLNEQIITEYGFSVSIAQTEDAGTNSNENNGAIAATLEYADPNGVNWFSAVRDGGEGLPVAGFFASMFNFLKTSTTEVDESLDPNQSYSNLGDGFFYPFGLAAATPNAGTDQFTFYVTPAWKINNSHRLVRDEGIQRLNNVDIVFTSDQDKWSRCIVVETASEDYIQVGGLQTVGGTDMFDLRASPSVGKDGEPDGDGEGYSWFPGYAVDVETGKRLNIFFGENSIYNEEAAAIPRTTYPSIGADMLFNPSSQLFNNDIPPTPGLENPADLILGGHHYIYVTRQEYDGCEDLHGKLEGANVNVFGKIDGLPAITWSSMVLLPDDSLSVMLPYSQGAILNDLTVKLRVDNPYNMETKFDILNPRNCVLVDDAELPSYQFEIRGKSPTDLTEDEYEGALAQVNVAPNPYYAYSAYENSQFDNTVKITNLPDKATVTIYSLDGKFIKRFNRDERVSSKSGSNPGVNNSQTSPNINWDIKNAAGIPIASGVYLIHISAPDLREERTIKWFGVNRKFDPSGL
ncbi:MAG: hypothetical protein HKO66_04300 [Saprospiraceae bacterium]|nr:hypothetical protein [Bacteroidia bacterium]NNE13613.1 hypothetical protein [Saprospiraceae bacterium]NNL91432.1 hypothetical protein [Saprospiraceae bacterium]